MVMRSSKNCTSIRSESLMEHPVCYPTYEAYETVPFVIV